MEAIPVAQKTKPRIKRTYVILVLSLLFSILLSGTSLYAYHTINTVYHRDIPLARTGKQDLENAIKLLESLSKNPLDSGVISQAHSEFVSAHTSFTQLNSDIQFVPSIASSIPVYGSRIGAAQHLLPIALEMSQIGMDSCDVLSTVNVKIHNAISKNQNQGLTQNELSPLVKNLQQIAFNLNLVIDQVMHLQSSDIQAISSLSDLVATFKKNVPLLRGVLDATMTLLPLAPMLLGIGTPTNYLIEVLDSTELRPGGGFIGNYGIATFNNGQPDKVKVTDTYLLDGAFLAAGHTLPYPSTYSWYPAIMGVHNWSLRDSNLDANFPTDAQNAELNYQREGGSVHLQGVMAITPAFIQQVLEITGPIDVFGYNEIVTAQNLIERIHYHQVGGGYEGGDTPSPDGLSSVRKHFMAFLTEALVSRLHKVASAHVTDFIKLFVNAVQTKDIQLYFNAAPVESLLQRYQIASVIQPTQNDSIFVVDANLSGNKANYLITSTLNDQIEIDRYGNATHHTTIKYEWANSGPIYGNSTYNDYVRIYVPAGSKLSSETGWQSYGTSESFGRSVFAGFFSFEAGQSRTITLSWSTTHAVSKDSSGFHYRYLIQKQAGTQWQVHIYVTLPSCATKMNSIGGLTSVEKRTGAFTQPLRTDSDIGVDYQC